MDRITVFEATPGEVADEWCALARSRVPSYPFLYPAWHAVWWERFSAGRTLILLAVRDNGRLAALAPLMRDGDRLTLAGDAEICDYMDLVVAPDAPEEVYARLLDGLAAVPWREVTLWGVPADSRTLAVLPKLAAARGWTVEDEFEAVCPRVALPDSWDGYLASLSKKDRHELRRKMRRFVEAGAGMAIETLAEPGDVAEGLDDFIRLHTISRHDKREFMTAQMEDFFRAMAVDLAKRGLVRLLFVQLDGTRVAGLLAFDTGDELLLYNSGYDPAYAHASIGLVSKALALRAAITDGKRVYDFLRGAEPYKYDLGAVDREVRTLTIRRAPVE